MQSSLPLDAEIPVVIQGSVHPGFLGASGSCGGRGDGGRLNPFTVTDVFYALPGPRFANAEPLPCLLVYLCYWPKMHKFLPRAGSFLIGPGFAASKVIPDGSFCFNFWRRLGGKDVLRVSIPSQNQKEVPKISKASTNQ